MAIKQTEQARKALVLAKNEARRFNHSYLGTEHMLLGLVAVEQGIAGTVLRAFGVDLPRMRETVVFMIGRGEGDANAADEPPATPRAERALAAAAQEAGDLDHRYIGTEHLLLGLLSADNGDAGASAAMRILAGLGLDPTEIRSRVLQAIAPTGAAPRTRDNVVTCRVDDRVLGALDALVEAGVYTTRSEAAARLIMAGLEANRALLDKVYAAATRIQRVRAETQELARPWADTKVDLPAPDHDTPERSAPPDPQRES